MLGDNANMIFWKLEKTEMKISLAFLMARTIISLAYTYGGSGADRWRQGRVYEWSISERELGT